MDFLQYLYKVVFIPILHVWPTKLWNGDTNIWKQLCQTSKDIIEILKEEAISGHIIYKTESA